MSKHSLRSTVCNPVMRKNRSGRNARRMMLFTLFIFASMHTCIAATADDEEPQLIQTFGIGGYYSSGDYGLSKETRMLFLPLSYELARFPFAVRLTLPFLSISGPGGVLPQSGNLKRFPRLPPPPTANNLEESGLGDMTLEFGYQLTPMLAETLFVDLGLIWKLPTASEEIGLGTGEHDLGMQIDLYKTVGSYGFFSTLGYTVRGSTTRYDLKDSPYISLGAAKNLSVQNSVGISLDFRGAAAARTDPVRELVPYYSHRLSNGWSWMIYSVVGLSDSSPDLALGFQISFRR